MGATPGSGGRAGGDDLLRREFSFSDQEFRTIADLLHQRTGIVLGANKQDMVYGRLARRLRTLGMQSFTEYCAYVTSAAGGDELTSFTNALTTNLTSFFREKHHFDHLRTDLLPARIKAAEATGRRRLRIWSAGCSSGEEAYSAAMVVLSTLPDIGRWDARILATDIDSNMVAHGAAGIYDADRVAGVPEAWRKRYVTALPGQPGKVRMAEDARLLVAFKRLNLLGNWPMRGPFDVIFCRNVAIYFDKPTQARLHGRLADLLADDGVLYIGHSETMMDGGRRFKAHGRTIYTKL